MVPSSSDVVLIGLGSNIPGRFGTPLQTLGEVFSRLRKSPVVCLKKSRIYQTPPFGNLAQPDFFNAVAFLETALSPFDLLTFLHDLEREAGRVRAEKWGPRPLDLDLLDYRGLICAEEFLTLPHPHMTERLFVLEPLCEIFPAWRHPVLRKTAQTLLNDLRELEQKQISA